MGAWKAEIRGFGPHHTQGPDAIEGLLRAFVEALKKHNHQAVEGELMVLNSRERF